MGFAEKHYAMEKAPLLESSSLECAYLLSKTYQFGKNQLSSIDFEISQKRSKNLFEASHCEEK